MLATGKSFRTSRESDIVGRGLPSASIAGEAHVNAGSIRLSCTLAQGAAGLRKVYAVNGRGVRYASYLGKLRVVSFAPRHLALLSGPAAARRSLMDASLAQESPAYYAALAAYRATLLQKNALLRGAVGADATLLETYDERLVATGTALMLARHAFVAELAERARAVHRAWVGAAEGSLDVTYAADVAYDVPTEDGIGAAFIARLAERRRLEQLRGRALVGPHRDDVLFSLDGMPLGAFGSQGQQRTVVLALKVAEYGLALARGGEAPLLLLDDVLSELDGQRQRAFLDGIGTLGQAFVTSAQDVDLPATARYRIESARLEPLPSSEPERTASQPLGAQGVGAT